MENGLNKFGNWTDQDYEKEAEMTSKFICPFINCSYYEEVEHRSAEQMAISTFQRKAAPKDYMNQIAVMPRCQGPYCMAYDIEERKCKRVPD